MKKVLYAIAFVFLLILCSCAELEEYSNVKKEGIPYYEVKIEVDFIPNIIFSKYDVILKVDGKKITTLDHGKDWTDSINLSNGTHSIEFGSLDDYSISNSIDLEVDSDLEVKYQISCYSDKISIEEVFVDRHKQLSDDEIKIQKPKNDYLYKNYKDVEEEFINLGFKNIKCEPKYDIYWGITEEESVYKVVINGNDDFKKGEVYNNNDEIIIKYHLSCEKDPALQTTSIVTTTSLTTTSTTTTINENVLIENDIASRIIGESYVSAREILKEMGYVVKYEHEYTHLDFTGELTCYTDEELETMGFIITGIKKIDVEIKNIELYVNTGENIKRIEDQNNVQEKLEEYLDATTALAAMEVYGKEQYPYGFSIHMMTGKIAETAIDEKTWFMKYEATVKNEFKKKVDVTCEAKITGPPDNPKVYDFIVY